MKQHDMPLAARFIAAMLLAAAASPSNAFDPVDTGWKPDALEIARLPMYCKGQFHSELAKLPGHSLPDGCGVWINHFCPAIVALNRARDVTLPRKVRSYSLRAAADHLHYTRNNLQPTCPLKEDLQALESSERLLRMMVK